MVQSSYPICATGHCSLAQSLHTHLSDAASLGTCQFNIGHFGGQPTSQRAPSTVSGSVSDWKSLRLSPKTFLTPFVHSRIFLLLSDKPQRINVVYLDHKLARDTYEENTAEKGIATCLLCGINILSQFQLVLLLILHRPILIERIM